MGPLLVFLNGLPSGQEHTTVGPGCIKATLLWPGVSALQKLCLLQIETETLKLLPEQRAWNPGRRSMSMTKPNRLSWLLLSEVLKMPPQEQQPQGCHGVHKDKAVGGQHSVSVYLYNRVYQSVQWRGRHSKEYGKRCENAGLFRDGPWVTYSCNLLVV